MRKQSAGILLYRFVDDRLEVLLTHPGGPYWARKDEGAWTIPKGEFEEDEDALTAAWREVEEELGSRPVASRVLALAPVRQRGGKIVHAWAAQADFDPASLQSNTFTVEWPPRSGRMREYPEVDRAAWMTVAEARHKMLAAQVPLLDALERLLG
ncbi:MAG TPA: NUDIX domain-containing protein [Candidatus Binatia bacterium]|nr:NUDIX domain-containing protein [Candidatus Binatia bacterium]